MASPFSIFRKHQKLMIATLAVLAMFAFVFLPIVLRQMGSRSTRNPVVVETDKYGDLRESEIEALRWRRQVAVNFLERVEGDVVANGGRGQVAFDARRRLGPNPPTEQSLVDSWLHAQYAAELGLVVSDEAVNDFIKEVSEDRIRPSQFTKRKRFEGDTDGIFRQVGVNELQLFEILREELLALQVRRMFDVSLRGATPAQRWDYFTRLKRLAVVEAMPVAVAGYADKIKDPGDEVLEEFFEKHKDNEARPGSPDPGFSKPQKIAVQYFKADYEKFKEAVVVTEKDVRDVYDQNKDVYDRWADTLGDRPQEEKPAGEAEKPAEEGEKPAGEDEKTPAENAADAAADDRTEGTPTEASEDKPEKEAEGATPDSARGEGATPDNATPDNATPDNATPDGGTSEGADQATPAGKEPAGSESDETSSVPTRRPIVFASLLQEPTAAKPEMPEAKQPNAEPEGEPEAPATATEAPATATEAPAPEASASDVVDSPGPKTEEPPAYPPGRTPEDIKRLLEGRVGAVIRETLVMEKVDARIDEIFGHLQEAMNQYRNKWIRYGVDLEEGREGGRPPAAKPKELDFDALAKEYGLTAVTTPLMSQADFLESRQFDIGSSRVDQKVPFVEYAFERTQQLYGAGASWGMGPNDLPTSRFLFWKVKETEPRPAEPDSDADQSLWHGVAEFKDEGMRDEVLRVYRMVQARKLAIAQAQRFAEQARKSGKSLGEVFPDRDVTLTEPFSWMTYGSVPAEMSRTGPRLSEVPGVEMPGRAFMRAVFDIDQGGVGVAVNQPEKIAYVVRVVEVTPSQRVLQDQFEVERYSKYARVAFGDQWDIYEAWRREIETDAGLKWLRPARGGRGG